ncbi:hypothetical protein GGI20_003482 [Coemansia sp. BCRC 34301]|nr:hypothetical protein GGI20_003482 [Coemansia sp. BCRC 34301]
MHTLSLPVGHLALVPVLGVSHGWRMRAARLFYGTAVIGTRETSNTVKTNIGLILESGYAPKTTSLVVYTSDMAAVLVGASRFFEFVWPSITRLYFCHPVLQMSLVPGSDAESVSDRDIVAVNECLARSAPRLSHVCALSNARDSFGLFALDDLLLARLAQLRTLTLMSQAPLRLGANELPRFLTRLTIRSNSDILVSVPRTAAASLVSLEIGPVSADDLWVPFTGAGSSDFACLRDLRLAFGSGPQPLLADDDGRRHLRRHRRSSRGSATGGWPLFPRLTSLTVEGYPFETASFLENFPRSQLAHLALRRCTYKSVKKFALTPFTGLASFVGDAPDCGHSGADSLADEWVGQTLQAEMPTLRSLSLTIGVDVFVELPTHLGLGGLQQLTLHSGLRLSEVEKILLSLGRLRTLRVTVTEVLGRTHEYLSRTTRHHKYAATEMPWLSTSLESWEVWLLEPSPGRCHRALLKIINVALRVPSILRIATQQEHVDELRTLGQCLPAVQIKAVTDF